MQSKQLIHNNLHYDFHYLEKNKAILIFKQAKLTYMIRVIQRKGKIILSCNCPGAKYRGNCFHEKTSREFNFKQIVEPKSFLDRANEEFMSMWLEKRKGVASMYS